MERTIERSANGSSRAKRMSHADAITGVVSAYQTPLVRGYSWGRFKIFRQRFLEEIGQYLPQRGRVLDIGCGFGLFSLYYASRSSERSMVGIDLSERRVETARKAAQKLGLSNAHFEIGDARTISSLDPFDAIYMLDVLHHIPVDVVPSLLRAIHGALPTGGIFVVKELDTYPTWQRVFAHALDLLMSPDSPPHYWPQEKLAGALEAAGFDVKRHVLIDYLPYPHVLFVATKR